MRRKKGSYFKTEKNVPKPVSVQLKRRAHFCEVDVMGIVWNGRYFQYFEEAAAVLGRKYGLSYKDFYDSGVRAPVVQSHIDYHAPIRLDEEFIIVASMIWTEAARINTEYKIIKEDGNISATGYTVQMFINAKDETTFLISPDILVGCRDKWKKGDI